VPIVDNPYTKRGQALEEAVAREWALELGCKIRKPQDQDYLGVAAGKAAREEHPWLKSNIDRVVLMDDVILRYIELHVMQPTGPGVLELKTTAVTRFKEIEKDPDPPRAWYYQVQQQLAFTGWNWGIISVWHPDSWRHLDFIISRDEEVIADILAAGDELWQKILAYRGIADESNRLAAILEQVEGYNHRDARCRRCVWYQTCHAAADDVDYQPSDYIDWNDNEEWVEAAREYIQAVRAKDEAENWAKTAKERLKELMGDRTAVMGGGIKVSVRAHTGLDTAKLKKAHPQIWRAFQKTTEYSVYTVWVNDAEE